MNRGFDRGMKICEETLLHLILAYLPHLLQLIQEFGRKELHL